MSRHLKWTDRKFEFTFPVEVYPEMIERVRGTPARLEDRVKAVAPEFLTRRDGERWSIQENAGHLLDLFQQWTPEAARRRILVANPARLYGFAD